MNIRIFRLKPIYAGMLVLTIFLVACSPFPAPTSEVTQGPSKEEVIALYGEPDRVQDFILPDEPFFGPQEGLSSLVPPGTVIKEWVYEIEDEELLSGSRGIMTSHAQTGLSWSWDGTQKMRCINR